MYRTMKPHYNAFVRFKARHRETISAINQK